MEKVMQELKWILIGLGIGLVCMYIAYFMPGDAFDGIKGYIFIFGSIVSLGYWIDLLVKVYNKLKKNEI